MGHASIETTIGSLHLTNKHYVEVSQLHVNSNNWQTQSSESESANLGTICLHGGVHVLGCAPFGIAENGCYD